MCSDCFKMNIYVDYIMHTWRGDDFAILVHYALEKNARATNDGFPPNTLKTFFWAILSTFRYLEMDSERR